MATMELWEIKVLLDDIGDEAGVLLPSLTPEILGNYEKRIAWVRETVRLIQEAALDDE